MTALCWASHGRLPQWIIRLGRHKPFAARHPEPRSVILSAAKDPFLNANGVNVMNDSVWVGQD
jgi:hypothetical protein